ncbi:MAG: transcriptional repressor [Pseudomonadota bacterium]
MLGGSRGGSTGKSEGRSGRQTHAERVLAHLRRQEKPQTAYQILEDLRSDGVTAPTTVYRALDHLVAAGDVCRIESLNAWTARLTPSQGKTPVFEICEHCGSVTEHVDTRLARDIAALSRHTGFQPERSILEIRGRCGSCRSLEPAP